MSKKLTNFENKIKYLKKDWTELFEDIWELFKNAWFLGMDLGKAIAQTVSLWEMIPNIPEFMKVGKYLGKVLAWFKNLTFLKDII